LSDLAPKKQILLTNDDGIRSPGLWAAAAALAPLGYVTVVAPLNQWSGAGRSMPDDSEGRIYEERVTVGGQTWQVHAVSGTPAQAVQHGLVELMPAYPDLIVAGINYGENVGTGVTISGTVGAALEGASFGVPGLAVSLQTESQYHLSHSTEIDFTAAAYFTHKFARLLLGPAAHLRRGRAQSRSARGRHPGHPLARHPPLAHPLLPAAEARAPQPERPRQNHFPPPD
jgi:5'-nucleotidase